MPSTIVGQNVVYLFSFKSNRNYLRCCQLRPQLFIYSLLNQTATNMGSTFSNTQLFIYSLLNQTATSV